MAAYEILLLNTAIPQIQAAQTGDTYVVPRDIAFSTVASLAAGTEALPSLVATGDVNTGFWFPAADTIAASTGGTRRLTLDASGNLGLGVAPSAWRTGFLTRAIQVGPVGSLSSLQASVTNNQTYLSSNCYLGTSDWIYLYSNAAAQYRQYAGQHNWFIDANAASPGAAGTAISFTQAMTLDASGRLLIGETADKTQEGLRVSRSGQASMLLDNTGKTNGSFVGAFNDAALLGVNRNPSTGVFYNTSNYAADIVLVGSSSTSYIAFETAAAANTAPTERARITSGGYFKASNSGAYNGAANSYHENYNSASDEWITWFQSAPATNPKGLRVYYSAAAPNGTANHFLYCDDTGGQRASIRSNGGLANYQSNNVDLSDARTKTDINPLGSYWSKIAGLEIVTYKYKDQTHDDLNIGVIAQQVEQVAPEFVDSDGFGDTPEDGVPLKTIYNKDLTFAAIKALQEAMARIETLEAKIAVLESKGV